jgi:hypothetical protein
MRVIDNGHVHLEITMPEQGKVRRWPIITKIWNAAAT